MGDFTRTSNFNPNANFKSVRIGSDCPVLEVELNEMQDIAEDKCREMIRRYVGDGLNGEGDFIYNNGILTITNEGAFVDGHIIDITKLQIAVGNGQSVYLKVWDKIITYADVIKYKGNQQEERTVENLLLDDRVKEETSRRIQVAYDLSLTNEDTSNNAKYLYLGRVVNGRFAINTNVKSENSRTLVEKFEAKVTQQVFTVSGMFIPNTNAVSVYRNGIFLMPNVDFIEVSESQIQLQSPSKENDEIIILYHKVQYALSHKELHASTHHKDGDDALDVKDLADKTSIIDRIEKRLTIKELDCGSFADASIPDAELFDGGYF